MPPLTEPRPERPATTADRAVITGRDPREQATIEAIRRMRRPGCSGRERDRLREQVVRWNLPIAHRLAQRYRDRGESLDDLRQVAALALVKAVDRYDPERGRSFVGYAAPTILGEVKRHFRDRVWSVHVPRQVQEHCLDVTRARAELVQRLQRAPSAVDIAAALGVTEAEVRATDASFTAYRADSLNRRVGPDHDACERQDLLGAPDLALETACDRVTLEAALDELPERCRHVVRRYFFDNQTQDQIAAELRTSQMSVSRMLAQTMARLRARLSPPPGGASSGTNNEDRRGDDCGLRVRTYEAQLGCLVATVRVSGRRPRTEAIREELMHLVLHHRPRLLVIDVRHLRQASPVTVRALFDAYRACGHVGGKLHVVNVAPGLFQLLDRAGVTHLFPCRMLGAGAPPAGPPAARRSPPAPAHAPHRMPGAVPSGRRCAARPAVPPKQLPPASTPATRKAAHVKPLPVLRLPGGWCTVTGPPSRRLRINARPPTSSMPSSAPGLRCLLPCRDDVPVVWYRPCPGFCPHRTNGGPAAPALLLETGAGGRQALASGDRIADEADRLGADGSVHLGSGWRQPAKARGFGDSWSRESGAGSRWIVPRRG